MNRDLVIGLVVSAALHLWLLFGYPAKSHGSVEAVVQSDVLQIEMPDVATEDEEPPEEVVDAEAQEPLDVPPPPQLPDVPARTLTDTTFTMRLQPTVSIGIPGAGTTILPRGPTEPKSSDAKLGAIVDVSKLDFPPRARSRSSPLYPPSLLKDGPTGTVVVRFAVETDGSTSNATVVRRGLPEFEKAAPSAIATWRFEPGLLKGKKVRFWMTQKLDFALGG